MATEGIRLSAVIAPKFHPVHIAIKRHDFTHYWLHGGRGSTKSSFAAIQVVLGIKRDPDVNAIVLRKVGETLRDSVYADILRATDRLGVAHEFHASLSPMEVIYRPTGQRIIFRGTDSPDKLKSLTLRKGYIGIVWYEELDQFAGMHEIRSINQSLLRGGPRFTCLYTFNPPRSRDSWVNKEITRAGDRLVHHSTFQDVPREWLGDVFLAEAEELKASDESAYRHEYLGEPVGLGGAVFNNLEIRAITDEEIAEFDRCKNGVDYGWWPDPWVYVRTYYHAAARTLYVFDEDSAHQLPDTEAADRIKAKLGEVKDANGGIITRARIEEVTCDSAERKAIRAYFDAGIDARPCRKWPKTATKLGSLGAGMRWLERLHKIVIDPTRAPLCAEEFPAYEHPRDRSGAYLEGYPDKNDHGISAVRYANDEYISA